MQTSDSLAQRFVTASRWERIAIGAWSAAIIVICTRVLIWPHAHDIYPVFSTAGRNWLQGRDLYQRGSGFTGYRYSPLAAALLVPFGLIPDFWGAPIWRLLNAAVYLAGLLYWSRRSLPQELSREGRAKLFVLILPLSLIALNNGQSNALAAGLLLLTFASVASDRYGWASVCLTMACYLKLYPIAAGLLLAALYRLGFAWRFGLALALAFASSFLLQHPSYVAVQYAGWYHHLLIDDRTNFGLAFAYRDSRLILRLLGMPISARAYLALEVGVGLALLLTCLKAQMARWDREELLELVLALSCCWITVFGPATESSTYIFLAPPLAWAILDARLRSRPRSIQALLLLSYLFLLPTGMNLHGYGQQPLATLILLGYLTAMALFEPPSQASYRGKRAGAEVAAA